MPTTITAIGLMSDEKPIPQGMPIDYLEAWVNRHPQIAIWIGAFWLWVSIVIILRMWLVHRRATVIKKVTWTFILLVPIFGWFLYAGCFQIPDYTSVPLPPTDGISGAGV